jgi:hypothetical protein
MRIAFSCLVNDALRNRDRERRPIANRELDIEERLEESGQVLSRDALAEATHG